MNQASLDQLLATLEAYSDAEGKGAGEPIRFDVIVEEISERFKQVEQNCDQLSEDLLNCYEHLNMTFSTITAVAYCKAEDQALETLTDEISRAINSDVSYYWGPLLAGGKRWCDYHQANLYTTCQDSAHDEADYLQRHHEPIFSMIRADRACQVAMVDYSDKQNHDHEGRGNVLVISLSAEGTENTKGYLVFIRCDDSEPFAAIEMNLADSLAKMGSAVLDGIIYASRLNQAYLQTITSLVRAIEAKDAYTCGHSERVAAIALILGEAMELPEQELKWLEWAGLLHDIGKIGIDDQIIRKAGKLTDEEYAAIKSHPSKTYQVLEPIEALRPALAAAKHHHERYDGKGYPDGLAGEDIPLEARILQIADIWDALTSTRSYRKALSREKALEIMRSEAGIVVDPVLFSKFEAILLNGDLPMEVLEPADDSENELS